MINKIVQSMAEAMDGIKDGSTILLGGFGAVGQPDWLLDGLIEYGAKDLTVVANNAGTGRVGLAKLMEMGRVRRIICSFPRSAGSVVFEELYKAGKLELEIVPQGTLAERMHAAGAGVLEYALHGDVALVEAWQADRWGNLVYNKSGRNFNPVMAMAAKLTIAQTHHIAPLGTLDPEAVVTPGIFVDRVIELPKTGDAA